MKTPNDPQSRTKDLGLDIPKGTKMYRTTLSLPVDLAVGLNRLAKRLGITQSALVTALLSQAVPNLERLTAVSVSPDDPESVKRFRGASIDFIMDAVRDVLKKIT